MGKNFPQVVTLKEKSHLFEKTIKLIEDSFQYKGPFSFATDFAPLVHPSNHHNCFILIDENENVLAHIGTSERIITISGRSFPICLLGGIAVDEKNRGQGHFQTLMQDVLAEKRSDVCFFLLWSNQEKLYKKFGFYLCGGQFELAPKESTVEFKKTTYQQLDSHFKKDVQSLYESSFRATYLSLERSAEDWNKLATITSSDLFYREDNGHIQEYFFKGKGQDLSNVIHEYGTQGQIVELLKRIQGYGKVWMGAPYVEAQEAQYEFMLLPADKRLFSEFVLQYTNGLMSIREINVMKQEVFFDFNEETLVLEVEEFLRGVFGPGPFEELGEMKPLFLSGLDSI